MFFQNPVVYSVDNTDKVPRLYGKYDYSTDGNGFSQVLSDSITVTDSIAFSAIQSLSDTIGSTDSLLVLLTVILSTDSIGTFDSMANTIGQTINDSIGITDSGTFITALTKAFADSVTVTDAIALSALFKFFDSIGTSDTFLVQAQKALTDFMLVKEWISPRLQRDAATAWIIPVLGLAAPSLYSKVLYGKVLYSTMSTFGWKSTPTQFSKTAAGQPSVFTNVDGFKYNS